MNTASTVRPLSRAELEIPLRWAAQEGWNPGLYDAEAFHAADPEGFFGAFLGNELIGSLSAVSYGGRFGFLGLYIVKPEHRGQGHGMTLWRTAMEYLRGQTIGLDGVVERQADYGRSGFALAYRNVRYQGIAPGRQPPATATTVPLAALPFETVARYDAELFPAPRTTFLRPWIGQPESAAFGLPKGGGLAGYGMIRKCHSGWKIGPLFADTPEGAETLFLALRNHAGPGEPVLLDVPEPNTDAVALAARHGMTVVFETARMYQGAIPATPLARVFGITTFELG